MFEVVLCIIGYVFGSIPFGLVLCYLAGSGDIRKIGSGNIGATNVLRTGNKFLAFLTLILDAGKGAIPIGVFVVMNNMILVPEQAIFIGLGAVLGHNFPIWLKFKGGKGIATTFGTFLAATPFVGLLACLTWLLTALITRISSLSALVALGVCALAGFFIYGVQAGAVILLIALLGIIRHKDNIKRLLKREEPTIGSSKK